MHYYFLPIRLKIECPTLPNFGEDSDHSKVLYLLLDIADLITLQNNWVVCLSFTMSRELFPCLTQETCACTFKARILK